MSAFDPAHLIGLLEPFESASRIWVAFSGGMDSSVLLAAATEVRESLPGALHAIHVDHGLHPDSALWAAHCAEFCRLRAIPLTTEHLQLAARQGESLEALAREARYAVFAGLLGRGDLLLTAHHEDDQAETLLLALLRGSGARGLAAMPVEARLGRGYLVRPLLASHREELLRYARARGLGWIEDPSNAHLTLDRNFLRHQILPRLRTRWPAVSTTLSRSARHCAEAAQLVEGLALATLPQLFGDHPGTLSIEMLEQLDRPLQKAVLRAWLEQHGFGLPDTSRLERVLDEVVAARADANPLVAWKGCEVRRYRGDLFCLVPLPAPPARTVDLPWRIGRMPSSLELPSGLGVLEWQPAVAEAMDGGRGRAVLELHVRFAQVGHVCTPATEIHARRLKDLFQTAGVPSWLRPYVPLVFCADGLIAIAGVCGCAHPRERGLGGALLWKGQQQAQIGAILRTPIHMRLPG
ncbi:tRNA lysidine(34) synthetase TilS [Thiocystis violacea]|uniref:tRNA lysidine(34) synthetase TilS n=1 Tax=Thiocystis violacea TaxID=13725 RepID=UPI001908840F|nr:tRNA lysidine(34) synthetase TilS [Thiocystis violacea]MBK1722894.1 tRNA lysidine(34) synthetase TilS [Thiocystis violacea]